MKHILKCRHCNKYTMKDFCDCGDKTVPLTSLKYSLNDRLEPYRRKAKMHEYANRGLI